MPASRAASATPATSGASGPTTIRSTELLRASFTTACGSHGSIATHSAQRAIPGLPGAAISEEQLGDCFSRHASASSRPPEPSSRMFMTVSDLGPDDDPRGLLAEQKGGDNAPALSVSELSGALK